MARKNIDLARDLRKKHTEAERMLWKYLRSRQLGGLKFRRQYSIGDYIVDSACIENRVIIEVDGGQHALEKDKDIERDNYLGEQGFKVLRFWNNEVLANTEGVLEVIRITCMGDLL